MLPGTSTQARSGGIGGERYELIPPSAGPSMAHGVTTERPPPSHSRDERANATHPPAANPSVNADPKLSPLPPKSAHLPPIHQGQQQNAQTNARTDILARLPPSKPILLPEYRGCKIEQHIKPMRAHHCRICGTVRHALFSV